MSHPSELINLCGFGKELIRAREPLPTGGPALFFYLSLPPSYSPSPRLRENEAGLSHGGEYYGTVAELLYLSLRGGFATSNLMIKPKKIASDYLAMTKYEFGNSSIIGIVTIPCLLRLYDCSKVSLRDQKNKKALSIGRFFVVFRNRIISDLSRPAGHPPQAWGGKEKRNRP